MNKLPPKIKAKELIKKYHNLFANSYPDIDKKCAIIAQQNLLDKLNSWGVIDEYENQVFEEIEILNE